MVRRLLGMGVIAVSLAACSHAEVGYKGPRLEGAVRAWAVPMDSCGPITAERPMVCRSTFATNLTDQLLVVSCSLEALDESGTHLFTVDNGLSGFIYPGQRSGTRNNTEGDIIGGVTVRQVRAVDRYEGACDAHRWTGPIPTYAYEGD
jgi:hypothetical protein